MINEMISEVENALGVGSPTRRKKRGTTARTYRAPARRTVRKKRKAKRTTRRRY